MKTSLIVGFGGAMGSMARHGVNVAIHRLFGNPVPYATATVNVVGCLVIGVLTGCLSAGQFSLSDTARTLIFVGVLGGFTTFSSLGLDTLTLTRLGAGTLAIGNIVAQLGLGLGAVFAGYWLAK